MQEINIKAKLLCFGGAFLMAIVLFLGGISLTMPSVKIANLPKPNAVYQTTQEPQEQTVSPFGGLQGGGVMAQVPAGRGEIPSPPTAPSIPTLPTQPGLVGKKDFATDAVVVLGVLPPSVAIIQDGGKTVTVRLGDETSLGKIAEITTDGIVIGEQFFGLKSGGR